MDVQQTIEDVARRMTAAEPTAQLRTRVLERLSDRDVVTAWRVPTLALVGTLVLAAGGAATWWTRVSPSNIAGREPMAIAARRPPEFTTDSPAPTRHDTAPQPADSAEAPVDTRHHEQVWEATASPALVQGPAIVLNDIQPARLEMPLLEVAPLATEPLTMAPLVPMTGG